MEGGKEENMYSLLLTDFFNSRTRCATRQLKWMFYMLFLAGILTDVAHARDRMSDRPRDPETGIIKGAEPFHHKGTKEAAVLLVHGFASSPREMAELGKQLHAAGFTVSGIRLKGHGTRPEDMRDSGWRDWLKDTRAEYKKLKEQHKEVYVVGFSLGGLLVLHLATMESPQGVIALAPAFEITHKWYYILPPKVYARTIGHLIRYVNKSDRWIRVDDRSQVKDHITYSRIPLASVRQLLKLASIVKQEAANIREPVMFIHSSEDDVSSPRASRKFMKGVKSDTKKMIWLENSNHLITLDHEKEKVANLVLNFIAELHAKNADTRP